MSDAGLVPVKFKGKNLRGVSVFWGFENWTIKKNQHVLEIQIHQNFG